MAPFYPVYVGRSDGRIEISSKSRRKESNQPTDAQLDKTPDAKGVSDYYTKLDDGDTKEIDWRRKLGGMLVRELGGKEHKGKNYILAALPENYRLFEHLKYTVSETTGKLQKSSRNHAKGPNDRQDAYLYGHPLGRKKRYRSPADFFPHLLWLATDEKGDSGNCSCKVCSPEEFQIDDGASETSPSIVKSEVAVKKVEPIAKSAAVVKDPTGLKTRSVSQEFFRSTTNPSASPAPVPRIAPSISTAVTPTPLMPIRCFEQELDQKYGKLLFRPGELVWFNRGTAWGLSIITKRELLTDARHQIQRRYLLQPLSHPFGHPSMKIISQEDLLRPWLAWSAPGPTHQHLAAGGLIYDTVDWSAVLQGQYGQGDVEVDGSIFAAKAIDESYTLFDQIDNSTAAAGEAYWNGIYLGGEKIWLGEPIRLRIGSGSDIMILHDIVEKTRQAFANTSPSSTVYLMGDIYTFSTIMHNPNQPLPINPNLPQRLNQDLRYRNQHTMHTKMTSSYWKLMQPLARLGLGEIKGRWYESSLLLPILRGLGDFNKDLQRGEITDAGMWMNGRGDSSLVGNKIGQQKQNRRDAFGRAVPPDLRIGRGLDGPPEENVIPVETGSSSNPIALEEDGGPQLMHTGDGDIDQFMNLDPMDDGFAQQFANNGGHFFGDAMPQ
ncbi:MAG: hypothetical protein M1827_002391 [Pycnora praestabilis]|nr:MAG: hypothetical protein M1827_002391 [Pycnora praestabilis]